MKQLTKKMIFTFVLIFSIALTGCSDSNNANENKKQPKEEQKEEIKNEQTNKQEKEETTDQEVNEENQITLSDKWEDLQIIINGNFYQLPEAYKIFEQHGWEFNPNSRNSKLPLPGGAYLTSPIQLIYQSNTSSPIIKSMNSNIKNITKEDLDPKDTHIYHLYMHINNISELKKNTNVIKLAKNIHFLSTKKEIIEAYGKPNMISKSNGTHEENVFQKLEYKSKDDKQIMELGLNKENELIYINLGADLHM